MIVTFASNMETATQTQIDLMPQVDSMISITDVEVLILNEEIPHWVLLSRYYERVALTLLLHLVISLKVFLRRFLPPSRDLRKRVTKPRLAASIPLIILPVIVNSFAISILTKIGRAHV